MKKLVIKENDANQTLIKFLEKYMVGAPQSFIQKMIRKKRIKVNKKRAKPSTDLKLGDIIDIYIYDEVLEDFAKRAEKTRPRSRIDLDIAYENEDVVIVDKPANLLVHAADKGDYGKNVVDWLVDYLIDKKEYIPRLEKSFTPAIVNRLDRNTRGLVIGAKNRHALVELNKAVEDGSIKKIYHAIVEGRFEGDLCIENELYKDDNNLVHVVEGFGKKSKTKIRALASRGNYSLVEIELFTGRTHQIRASLSDIGHPIMGDPKYKSSPDQFENQALVASRLEFSDRVGVESLKNLKVESKYYRQLLATFERINK